MIGRPTTRSTQFSQAELDTLRSLRTRYQNTHPLFTDRELARLRFLRWLVRSPGWDPAMDQPVHARTGLMGAPLAGLRVTEFAA